VTLAEQLCVRHDRAAHKATVKVKGLHAAAHRSGAAGASMMMPPFGVVLEG